MIGRVNLALAGSPDWMNQATDSPAQNVLKESPASLLCTKVFALLDHEL